MKQLDWMIWILLIVVLCYSAYRQSNQVEDDCQTYDQMGHGIGCEGPDITDRM